MWWIRYNVCCALYKCIMLHTHTGRHIFVVSAQILTSRKRNIWLSKLKSKNLLSFFTFQVGHSLKVSKVMVYLLFIALLYYPMLSFAEGSLSKLGSTCGFFYANSKIQCYCNFFHNHPYHTYRAFLMYVWFGDSVNILGTWRHCCISDKCNLLVWLCGG